MKRKKKKKKKKDCECFEINTTAIVVFVITHFTVVLKIFSFSIVETHCLILTTMCCTNGYTYLSTYLIG